MNGAKKRVWLFGGLAIVLCALAGAGLLTAKVLAISKTGPDTAEYGGANAYYELSNTPNIVSTGMAVPVYYPTKPAGNTTIAVSYGNDGGGATGVIRLNGGGAGNPGSVTVGPGSFTLDTATGYYRAMITATITGGVTNTNYRLFRLIAPGSGLIGYSTAANTNHFAIGNSDRCDQPPTGTKTSGCGRYFNYALPFAPSCSTASGSTNIQIFDGDNPGGVAFGNYGAQPKAFTVQIRDTTTGANVPSSFSGSWGNGQTATISFSYTQYHKYAALLNGVYANNVIQFKLPFDSINTKLTCPTTSCGGWTIKPAALQPTTNYTITASVNVTGGLAGAMVMNAVDNFYIHVTGPGVDYQNDNVGGPPLGGSLALSASNITGTVTPPPTNSVGTYSVTWGLTGPLRPVGCPGGGPGGGGPPATFTVGYDPYFDVRGGDVVAGAGFMNGATTCTQDTTADIKAWNYDNTPANWHYGAGSQTGAFALGDISSFVTGLNPAANTTAFAGRTGAGTLSQGTPYGLSFANSPTPVNPNYGGKFGQLPCLEDYAGKITGGATTWTDDYGTSGTYTLAGPVTLAGGTLPKDTVINLKVNGDVFIAGPITYDDTGGPGHYPRLNVVATGSIYVAHGVGEIHGLFVAQGTAGAGVFASCATAVGVEAIDYDTCSGTPLVVHGAVAAKKLDLGRSYGQLDSNSGPAESFRLGPELWLAISYCTVKPTDPICTSGKSPEWNAVTALPPVL